MNNSIATEICCAFVVGMLPALFTYAFTNARLKNESNKIVSADEVKTEEIQSLKSILEEEQEKTRRLQSVVYHMVGKLYNDERNIQSAEVDYLFGATPIGENENIYPARTANVESAVQDNTLAKQIVELQAQVELQEKNFGSDYWSFNELFMRMHDAEKNVETQEDVIRELETKNSDLEKRVKVLEEMMNVLPPLEPASWDEPVGRWDEPVGRWD